MNAPRPCPIVPDASVTLFDLVDRLSERSDAGLVVYDRRGKTRTRRPYPEVMARARAWAAWLEASGVRPGDIVFLCLPTSHDVIEGFYGASLAGALPCLLAMPRAIGGLEVFKRRVELLGRFGRGHLVTTPEVGAELGTPFLAVPEALDLSAKAPARPRPRASELAYVQLTSGSTQTPKAVAITHSNLAENTYAIVARGTGRGGEAFVTWLPLYHDMGLVGMAFTAMHHGAELVLLPPEAFLAAPRRWLEAISLHPETVASTAPNFGYQWCVDRIAADQVAGLDLSRWRVACCGAEMIRPATVTEFAARFAPAGFKIEQFSPCYGMAEGTLAVTMCPVSVRAPLVHDGVVACGPPVPGMQVDVRPVGSEGVLPEGQEGEVVISGTSLFAGYHQDPEITRAVLREDGTFRTGDLGYLKGGELFITGRVKDLLILDGANVAPHELEWLAQGLIDLDGGRAAAFSVEHLRREQPVLVVEVKEVPTADVLEALRTRCARDVAPLHDLVLVRRGTLPKTSSGKVMRSTVKARYLDGTLEAVLWRHKDPAQSSTRSEA